MQSLSIYLVQDEIANTLDKENLLKKVLGDPKKRVGQTHGPYSKLGPAGFTAFFFELKPSSKVPTWLTALKPLFNELGDKKSTSLGGVLMVKVKIGTKHHHFLFSFGTGFHLIDESLTAWNFGVRTALNIIFEGNPTSARIRRVDSSTIDKNTFRQNKQSNKDTSFEDFGIDIQRDILGAVSGLVSDKIKEDWGKYIAGSRSLGIRANIDFENLSPFCSALYSFYRKRTYKQSFDWIDHLRSIRDPKTVEALNNNLIELLKKREINSINFAPPEIIEWTGINKYSYTGTKELQTETLSIEGYLNELKTQKKLKHLEIDYLRRQKIFALDSSGKTQYSWRLFQCVDAEMEYNGFTYLLVGGQYFETAKDYINEVDKYINELQLSSLVLPDYNHTNENDFNIDASNKSGSSLLCLDKANVVVKNRSSPVEPCDLISVDRQLIHVKHYYGSAEQSHLYGQGFVSAEMLQQEPEYRNGVVLKMHEELIGNNTLMRNIKPVIDDLQAGSIITSEWTVIYGVIKKWNSSMPLSKQLPFFSKVNLRRHSQALRQRGFKVEFLKINDARP